MIKFMHRLCQIGMTVWTFLCGLSTILFFCGLNAKPHPGADPAVTGTASAIALFMIGATWFFPMMVMVIAAYFTRPQAWEEKQKPSLIQPLEN